MDLPKDEDARALCLGQGWAAVATSALMLRLFSIGGVQREIFSLPGPVVCMVGHGEQLLIVYHRGETQTRHTCMCQRTRSLSISVLTSVFVFRFPVLSDGFRRRAGARRSAAAVRSKEEAAHQRRAAPAVSQILPVLARIHRRGSVCREQISSVTSWKCLKV